MEEPTLKSCPFHHEPSSMFCDKCKRMTCPSCLECKRHSQLSTAELIEKYKDNIKSSALDGYSEQIQGILKRNKAMLEDSRRLLSGPVEEAAKMEEKVSHSQEGIESDNKLITEAIQYMREVGEKAFTTALLDATQRAVETLDIEKEITKETEKYKQELDRLNGIVRSITRNIEKLEMEDGWVRKIETTGRESCDEELDLALSLCLACEMFEQNKTSGPVCDVPQYEAFPTVRDVFDIEGVMFQELFNVGARIQISKPIPIGKDVKFGDGAFMSLSHKGVFADCRDFNDSYFSDFCVFLTNLIDGRFSRVCVANNTLTGFYDDSLILLTYWRKMREGLVEDVFSTDDTELMKEIGEAQVCPYADVSLLNTTRALTFTTTTGIPYEYNVDTKRIKRLEIGMKVNGFASLLGMVAGVRGVFWSAKDKKHIFALNWDNSTIPLAGCATNTYNFHNLVLSSSNPDDLTRAMKINSHGKYFTNTKDGVKLKSPFKYKWHRSILRIYNDVFMVFDSKTFQWCLVRIIVS